MLILLKRHLQTLFTCFGPPRKCGEQIQEHTMTKNTLTLGCHGIPTPFCWNRNEPPSSKWNLRAPKDIQQQPVELKSASHDVHSWQAAQNGSTCKKLSVSHPHDLQRMDFMQLSLQTLNHTTTRFCNQAALQFVQSLHSVGRAPITSTLAITGEPSLSVSTHRPSLLIAPMWSGSCSCGFFGCRSWSTSLQIFSKMDCFFPSHLSSLASKISWSRLATSL